MIPDEFEETPQRDRTVVVGVGNAGTVAILLEAIKLLKEQAPPELEQIQNTLYHLKARESKTLDPVVSPIGFIPDGKPRGKGKVKKDWSR